LVELIDFIFLPKIRQLIDQCGIVNFFFPTLNFSSCCYVSFIKID
jgi:hypothetical protein